MWPEVCCHGDYLATIRAGVAHWEARHAGFGEDFEASTIVPADEAVAELQRIDAIGALRPPTGAR